MDYFLEEEKELKNNLQLLKSVKEEVEEWGEWPAKVEKSFNYNIPEVGVHLRFPQNTPDKEKHILLAWLTKKMNASFDSVWNGHEVFRYGSKIIHARNKVNFTLGIYLSPMPIGKNCKITTEKTLVEQKTLICSKESTNV